MARITKAMIYDEYGIKYRAKDGKILTPYNEWIKPLLPYNTNSKIGKAATFSIYHGNSTLYIENVYKRVAAVMRTFHVEMVKGSCPCHCDGCYCDSGCYVFDSVKAVNVRKLLLCRYCLEWVKAAIMAQIKADHIEQVRIHASGDFFSIAYAEMWKEVAIAFPAVTFWTYTKVDFALDTLSNIPNLKIVPSITPVGINFGTCAQLLKMYKALTVMGYRVHICACGTCYENHCAECQHGCKAIGKECDFVLFILHSTSYKAGENDPNEFKEVCEIIARQAN